MFIGDVYHSCKYTKVKDKDLLARGYNYMCDVCYQESNGGVFGLFKNLEIKVRQ